MPNTLITAEILYSIIFLKDDFTLKFLKNIKKVTLRFVVRGPRIEKKQLHR